MKTITTITAGVGLAAAVLGAVAAPAMAASTTNANQGDRVTGQVELWAGNSTVMSGAEPQASSGRGQVVLTDSMTAMGTWELPAEGTTGPITGTGAKANLCLTDDPANNIVRWEDCGGYLTQEWTLNWADNVGNGSAHSGYMIQPAGDTSRWLYDLSSNGWTATGSVTGTRPDRGIVIDNYTSLAPVASTATPVAITSPSNTDVTLRNPQFSGSGDDGAEVIVRDAAGVELCRATVTNGAWDCTTSIDLPDGPVAATATQTAQDGSTTTASVSIIIADPLNTPVVAPVLAAGAGVVLVASAGAAFFTRRARARA